MEIEKKYKVLNLPVDYKSNMSYIMEQGYLCSNPTVRIRKRTIILPENSIDTDEKADKNNMQNNDEYILTYKSKFGEVSKIDSSLCASNEYEMELSKNGYYHLKEKIDGNIVCKRRYHILLESGQTAELDIFEGILKGLMFVEVEFKSEEEALSFIPPEWFGNDVSMDFRYKNLYLSTINSEDGVLDLI